MIHCGENYISKHQFGCKNKLLSRHQVNIKIKRLIITDAIIKTNFRSTLIYTHSTQYNDPLMNEQVISITYIRCSLQPKKLALIFAIWESQFPL